MEPIQPLTKVTITLEDEDGEVATITCGPDWIGRYPSGHPRVRVDREETDPRDWLWPGVSKYVFGNSPLVEIVAGHITVQMATRVGEGSDGT